MGGGVLVGNAGRCTMCEKLIRQGFVLFWDSPVYMECRGGFENMEWPLEVVGRFRAFLINGSQASRVDGRHHRHIGTKDATGRDFEILPPCTA